MTGASIWRSYEIPELHNFNESTAMHDLENSKIVARVKQIRIESRVFIEECEARINEARRLCDAASFSLEEAMILKEESIAIKFKSLAVLKLANQTYRNESNENWNWVSSDVSINEETTLALKMMREISQDSISDENPNLHELKSKLMSLSFLSDCLQQYS